MILPSWVALWLSIPSKSEFNWSQYFDHEANVIPENIVSLYQAGAFFGTPRPLPKSGIQQANNVQELCSHTQQATTLITRRVFRFSLGFSSSELVSCWVRTE